MEKLCKLCTDCHDILCPGRKCHMTGHDCIIELECFRKCDETKATEAFGGFIAIVPVNELFKQKTRVKLDVRT